MRIALLATSAVVALAILAPGAAEAQSNRAEARRRGDWYRDVRPYLPRNSEGTVKEARLWDEFVHLRGIVRQADRRRDLSPRQADRFYDRLDRVARFLRDDRRLSNSEYNRRRDDLEDISRDLDRAIGRRGNR
jgi:hypothetical protein